MTGKQFKQFRQLIFLLDILKLALTAFGGPQIHFTQFRKLLVIKKNYLTEEELIEFAKTKLAKWEKNHLNAIGENK